MKLCTKCFNSVAISIADRGLYTNPTSFTASGSETAPASECEFWAHKQLNFVEKELDEVSTALAERSEY